MTQSAFIITHCRKTSCDCITCLPNLIFWIPLHWKTCNVYIEGKVLGRLLPGKWLSGVKICNSSTRFICYTQMLSRLKSGGLHTDGLTDLEQPQLYPDLVSVGSLVICTCTLRRQACRLAATQFQSQTYILAYHFSVWGQEGQHGMNLLTFLSIQGQKVAKVGCEIQINCYTPGTEGW